MGMCLGEQFLSPTRQCTVKFRARSIEFPIPRYSLSDEWTQNPICSRLFQEGEDFKCSLTRTSFTERQPSLPTTKHRTSSRCGIHLHRCVRSVRRIKRVEVFPIPSQYLTVDFTVRWIFPALETTAVDMGTECEFCISGMTDSKTVGVTELVRE